MSKGKIKRLQIFTTFIWRNFAPFQLLKSKNIANIFFFWSHIAYYVILAPKNRKIFAYDFSCKFWNVKPKKEGGKGQVRDLKFLQRSFDVISQLFFTIALQLSKKHKIEHPRFLGTLHTCEYFYTWLVGSNFKNDSHLTSANKPHFFKSYKRKQWDW